MQRPNLPRGEQTSSGVRDRLVDALRLDLVGPDPRNEDDAPWFEEELPQAPSKWYLTGFLIPFRAELHRADDDADAADLDAVGAEEGGDDDTTPEATSRRKSHFPASMGLSVLVNAETRQLRAGVRWGDYEPVSEGQDDEGRPRQWGRIPKEVDKLLDLPVDGHQATVPLEDTAEGLALVVSCRTVTGRLLAEGTRSVSVFLVNHRRPTSPARRDMRYAFQATLSLRALQPFVARPNPRGLGADDPDEQIADLQFRDAVEYAVGHNVSALADVDQGGRCEVVHTTWVPRAHVEKTVASKLKGVELGMEALAAADSPEAVRGMLDPMLEQYGAWIGRQRRVRLDLEERRDTAAELMDRAERARDRIRGGLDALDDALVFEAFQITNRTIARAIRQRLSHDSDKKPEDFKPPAWRPFQLAFVLMNMAGAAHPEHADRDIVDLLFFPTGGGKTEAYLGLAAFTLALRRLRDPTVRSAGVSVLMRYTLRLLTLDQLGRAATLICALELERQAAPEKLGPWPFEIGLWVGRTATPNRMGKQGDKSRDTARARTLAYIRDEGRRPSPIPLERCPWCGWGFKPSSFDLQPNAAQPTDLRVTCVQRRCAFHGRKQRAGLPVVAVDDPLYRRLPCFIIATVDKFANLPWVGETGALFGRVERYDDEGFYGPASPNRGKPLGGCLPPPDLVIQDELHLISGPLGTMVGLYETALDTLASTVPGFEGRRPKIVASTATVRRAEQQIQALFGRSMVDVFPPPGPNRRDSFFAKTKSITDANPRTYLGIAAPGRNLKVVLLRTYLALLSAAQRQWQEAGGKRNASNPADPYMTLLGYFNSLRELGGSRRIVEDEVTSRLVDFGQRRLRIAGPNTLFADRKKLREPRELTSRVSTADVAQTKDWLATQFFNDGKHVDVALATNMISVGLDITRLGLMVVLGQPKTAAEYIQTTSRVGRDSDRPGLVVTLMNVHRARDRSYYERFVAWHESFYRAVEATSVTPFSPRALDRGLAGVTVALARLGLAALTPAKAAVTVGAHRPDVEFVAEALCRRAAGHDGSMDAAEAEALRQKVKATVLDLLDSWEGIAEGVAALVYNAFDGGGAALLHQPDDTDLDRLPEVWRKFKAGRSLRDVEPAVPLWLRRPDEQEGGRR